MLDIKYIRENKEAVLKGIEAKQHYGSKNGLEQILIKDAKNRELRQTLEEKQALRNSKSKLIGQLKRNGESAEEVLKEMGQISKEV